MIIDKAISITIEITKQAQKVYFQIPLAGDIIFIYSLEYSTVWLPLEPVTAPDFTTMSIITPPQLPAFTVYSNQTFGQLALWEPGKAYAFWQGYIVEDANIHFGELIAMQHDRPTLWRFNRKRQSLDVKTTSGVAFLEGYYQDIIAEKDAVDYHYKVHLYLWAKTKKA